MDKELFADLMASLKEMQEILTGKRQPGRVTVVQMKPDTKAAGKKASGKAKSALARPSTGSKAGSQPRLKPVRRGRPTQR